MSKTVEFYFDVGSPTSYLAYTQLRKICDETGSTLNFRPMLLGGVFKATGNASPNEVPAKRVIRLLTLTDLPSAMTSRWCSIPTSRSIR